MKKKNLYINIGSLIGVSDLYPKRPLKGAEMSRIDKLDNAYLSIAGDTIVDYGHMNDLGNIAEIYNNYDNIYDVKNQFVIPGFIDTHTHLVFAQWREEEFIMKLQGYSYEEIAKKGGGILNSAKKVQSTSEEELFDAALKRIYEVINYGTVALEIKSGYGLSLESELKMLRVIKRLKEYTKLPIKSTFLGAHAVPIEYKENRNEYIDLIISKMLPLIADEGLAEYVDVFCDEGFFTLEETDYILNVAVKFGLKPRIHVSEMSNNGGVQLGISHHAISVDHLERIEDEEISALLLSDTLPTVLPQVSFFLKIPFAPARKMIDAGLPLVIASDYNPGTSPSGNLQFAIALSTIYQKLLPVEAINAITYNAAHALEIENQLGSIQKGKKASFLILNSDVKNLDFIPYHFASNKVEKVIINGEIR
ncbi:MAG: imidazolonepropionase [Bacteroidales bacterium]|nr:imidazolonepropionase [Bacteroidales bacterium]